MRMPPVTPTPLRISEPRSVRRPTGLVLAALLALTGCASAPEPRPTQPPLPRPAVQPVPAATPAPSVEVRPSYRGPWEDPSNPLYNRTVYFDYDNAAIKPEYIGVLRNHAAYLAANAATKVTLEGNTDERGTREYNLALGDQRAEAVRKFMAAEGARPDQMATLSYGEERPASPGHGDASWQLNRRVVIQY